MALGIGSAVVVLLDGGDVDMMGEVVRVTPTGMLVVRLEDGKTIREDHPRVADVFCAVTVLEDLLASAEYDEDCDRVW